MTAHDYDWWPDGADERHVRQCNCTTCEAIDHLHGNDAEISVHEVTNRD